ncbi:MAG: adenylate/guanylate cyclase domain-containing protein [Alphaproteobacteria bacterium]|nr:MAG: adenylate/guanylate cyclase domain-containing protein [Alphaproteobacteria bacterium]
MSDTPSPQEKAKTHPIRLLETIRRMRQRDNLPDDNPMLRSALERHKFEGLAMAVRARWVALAIIAVVLPLTSEGLGGAVLYYEAIIALFAVNGWAQLKVGELAQSRRELLLIWFDIILMTLTLLVPNPLLNGDWPTAMQFQVVHFSYFYILLVPAVMAYSWRTVFSFSTWVAVAWLIGVALVINFGHTIPQLTPRLAEALGPSSRMAQVLDPNRVSIGDQIQEVIIFAICAITLAINTWRTNQLVVSQAEVAQERSNLARYFAPRMVDALASQTRTLGEERSQMIALLFADIVGFTRIAEQLTPASTMDLLREFHRRMEQAVFSHEGTLNKFLGDGLMASFGTPDVGPDDARNALAAARDMIRLVDEWNEERQGKGLIPVKLSIGIHYGEVTLGNIGSERILEFAVIGDTVNVASRLEGLTREIDTSLIVSETLYEKVRDGDESAALLAEFLPRETRALRGRDDPVSFYALKENPKE